MQRVWFGVLMVLAGGCGAGSDRSGDDRAAGSGAEGVSVGIREPGAPEIGVLGGLRPEAERRVSLVAGQAEIVFQEPQELEGASGGMRALYISVDGRVGEEGVLEATYDYRKMDAWGVVTSAPARRLMGYDERAGRFYLDLALAVAESQAPVTPSDLHRFGIRLVLADGSVRNLGVSVRLRVATPGLRLVEAGALSPSPDRPAWPLPLYRETFENAANAPLRVWIGVTGTGQVTSWLKTRRYKVKKGFYQGESEVFEATRGVLRMGVRHEKGPEPRLLSGGLGYTVEAGERITVSWIAEPAEGTRLCSVHPKKEHRLRLGIFGGLVSFFQSWKRAGARLEGGLQRQVRSAAAYVPFERIPWMPATPEIPDGWVDKALTSGVQNPKSLPYDCQGVLVH